MINLAMRVSIRRLGTGQKEVTGRFIDWQPAP